MKRFWPLVVAGLLGGCALGAPMRGTADLGVVIERGSGSVQIVENSHDTALARITGLGDLSHASVVFGRSGRRVWVNFAFPDNDTVQVIDVPSLQVVRTLHPGKAILHMEFSARGDEVWISSRDDNRLVVVDAESFATRKVLPAAEPSGIFFGWRVGRMGM